jgi:hypothetical protein
MKALLFISLLSTSVRFFDTKFGGDLQTEEYLNFLSAIQNESTFSYFTVIKAKNLNTGEIKEICTKGNFVSGALHIELKKDYSPRGEKDVIEYVKKHKDRYFEFKDQKALENISFYEYNPASINRIEKKYKVEQIVAVIKETRHFSCSLPDNEMKLLAHALFERGFMTGENNCFGGTLEYVERK